MLQDVEVGHRLQVEPGLRTFVEQVGALAFDAPAIEAKYGLVRISDQNLRR